MICVDLFIQTDTIMFGTAYGDNRDFDYNSDPGQSRGYVYIYLDEKGNIVKTEQYFNRSRVFPDISVGPFIKFNRFNVTRDADTGDIRVDWELTNGVSGLFLTGANYARNGAATWWGIVREALLWEANVYDALGNVIEPINGTMVLTRNAAGKYKIAELERDPYPSLEVYAYNNGQYSYTIDRRRECCSGRPDIGLKPSAPRDIVWRSRAPIPW